MNDPFKPLSAKQPTAEATTKLRRSQGASHGGKAHRGKNGGKPPILFGNRGKPRKKPE
jgi:hypothetical protein